jgi:PDZ domain-containing secreted protein
MSDAKLTEFEIWWKNEGSGMPPKKGEDAETHVKRLTEIAWSNATYLAQQAAGQTIEYQDKCSSFPKEEMLPSGKEIIICIDSDAEGMGSHINSRNSALEWFTAYLQNLEDGDEDTITIKRKDMTKEEIAKLPEL